MIQARTANERIDRNHCADPRPYPRLTSTHIVVAIAITGIFLYCAGFGLKTPLGNDDIMNLSFAWTPPLRELAAALLVPFTHFYRPTGAALYRLILHFAGLNASAFRAVFYLLLWINLFLTYQLATRLSGRREIGVLSALLYTFHGRLSGIYLNNGTIYDVLCVTFVLALLSYYVHVRQSGRPLTILNCVIVMALFTLAINAKEMAAVVPLLLFAYEIIYRPSSNSAREFLINCIPAILCGILAVLAATAKMGPGSQMHGNPAYVMTFTWAQFLDQERQLTSRLFYFRQELTQPGLFVLWALLSAVILLARRACTWFSAVFAFLAPLPVLFLPGRGFFVMYLPLVGWVILFGSLLVYLRDYLLSLLPHSPARSLLLASRIALFVIAAAAVVWVPKHDRDPGLYEKDPSWDAIRLTRHDILTLREPLPVGAKVLFLHDRFPADSWIPVMLCRLLYRDRTLWADRPSMMNKSPDQLNYDRVFDYTGGKLFIVRSRPVPAAAGTRPLIWPR